jgi:predicted transcriptional regulator
MEKNEILDKFNTLNVPRETYNTIKKLSIKYKTTMSEIMVESIKQYEKQTQIDKFEETMKAVSIHEKSSTEALIALKETVDAQNEDMELITKLLVKLTGDKK